jgi:branched-chain amino acid transport system substrate-binding protein
MKKWIAGLALSGTMIATLGVGPSFAADNNGDITIGFAVALSGWMSAVDADGYKMAQLWIDQTNAAGGLLGHQIKQIAADTKTDPVEGAKAGAQLVQQGANLLVVSADYDYGSPAAIQAQKAGIVSVFLGALDPRAGVSGVGPLSFTAGHSAQLEGATMADWGYKKQGYRSAFVILSKGMQYSKSVCSGYEWEFKLEGGKVGDRDSVADTDVAFDVQVTHLANAVRDGTVDHVVLCAGLPALALIKQIRAANIDIPILSGGGFDGSWWFSQLPNLKGFYIPTELISGGDPRPDVEKLSEAFAAKYGSRPATQFGYMIYAWLELWAKAVKEAGTTDAKAVTAEMNKFTNEPTTLGPRTFTPTVHIQTRMPLFVATPDGNKQTIVANWTIPSPVPSDILNQ